MILSAKYIAVFYIPAGDETVRAIARIALQCYAVTLPFLAFNSSVANYFLSLKYRFSSYLISFASELLFPVLMAYVLGKVIGINGIFIALAVGQIVLALLLVMVAFFRRDNSRAGLAKFLLLSSNLVVADVITADLSSMNEVIDFSQRARDFCVSHNIDKKRSFHVALCIEELGINVIQHGFKADKKYNFDVRLVIDKANLFLRLRACLVSFYHQAYQGQTYHLSRIMKFSLTVFP